MGQWILGAETLDAAITQMKMLKGMATQTRHLADAPGLLSHIFW